MKNILHHLFLIFQLWSQQISQIVESLRWGSIIPGRFLLNRRLYNKDHPLLQNPGLTSPLFRKKIDYQLLTEQNKYDLQWYVIGTPTDFFVDRPTKVKVWEKEYVVWKGDDGLYRALDNACPHKGASLAKGKIIDDQVVCPYHGYEYAKNGTLTKVPGICFHPSRSYDNYAYPVVEKNGWVYLNTYVRNDTTKDMFFMENIYEEPEAHPNFTAVAIQMDFGCYSRILSENSLDIMHIAFVHTFGNENYPAPTKEQAPERVGDYHYRSSYLYQAGDRSVAKRVFGVDELQIENEFILPHTTVARVIFGDKVSTIITFALPIGDNKSRLFVKTYRNFFLNSYGDYLSKKLMLETMNQDREIVENIHPCDMDGKFNMKFDKLQNTYKTFYKKLIHKFQSKDCE
jgi:vanillate O-demethylase monooxygenase subunit